MCSVSDALLARNLRDGNHLLWAVDPAVPDLRGSDQKDDPSALFTDDQPRVEVPPLPHKAYKQSSLHCQHSYTLARQMHDWSCVLSSLAISVSVEHKWRAGGGRHGGVMGWQVLRPGAYRCVCMELEVQHLAVAAITALEELTVLEGGESGGAAAGPPALPVLAKLVAAWLKDASERNSRCCLMSPSTQPLSPTGHLGCPGCFSYGKLLLCSLQVAGQLKPM